MGPPRGAATRDDKRRKKSTEEESRTTDDLPGVPAFTVNERVPARNLSGGKAVVRIDKTGGRDFGPHRLD